MAHRSSARSGKASRAGTLDTSAAHRAYLLKSRAVALEFGCPILPILRVELIRFGVDPDTGLRIHVEG